MQTFHRLRRLAAAFLLVPLCAGIQPSAAAQRTEATNVVTVVSLATPPGVLSGPLGSWLRSPPPANGNPLYEIRATANSLSVTDGIAATEWSVPAVVAENGAPGVVVAGSAIVYLYHRGAAAPAVPTGTLTYTFDTELLSGSGLNGWSQTIPTSDGSPLWVIAATVVNASGTGTITANQFGSVAQLGQDSNADLNVAAVHLYQRAASAPASPGGALTYTFPVGLESVPKSVRSDLLLATDGNIYFASSAGGKGYGAVARVSPDGKLCVVYSFVDGKDGLSSFGGLVQASDGNLYGTTYFGGDDGLGTVFKLKPPAATANEADTCPGEFTQLHKFTKDSRDPKYPYAGLVQAGDGNLYGTTRAGGDSNKGAIFRIATDGSGFAVIHSFSGGKDDGQEPQGRLVVGPDGLYGTTMQGGDKDRGVIYRITTAGVFTRLFSFSSLSAFNERGLATNAKGANPRAGLLLVGGKYYGTTYQGGGHGNGTVFRATVNGDSADVEVVHDFEGAPFDGGFPLAGVVLGPDGSFYGSTERGGYVDSGSAWKVAPDGSFELLHSFFGDGADGVQPYASLLFANSAVYGVSNSDSSGGAGVIFKLERDSGAGLPVNITVSQREITLGDSVTITWSAPGAAICDKFGAWGEAAAETDPEHVTPTSGSKVLSPGVGIYTYALACTDAANVVHKAYVGVYIKPPQLETVDGGEIVGGGALSWLLLALFAALLFVKLIKETRSSCP